ncbi:MAG: lysostaphin resistance A-like protein [Acidobacteriota bacterium]
MIKLNPKALTVILRVAVFAFLAIAGLFIFSNILRVFGYLVAGTLGGFAAAAVANALAMRIWEHGNLIGIGLAWNSASVRNLLLGLAGGIGSALIVVLGPVVEGAARIERVHGEGSWGGAILLLSLLIFGAIGEEMLFHGYAFQILMGALGPFATILPVSIVFALLHGGNLNVTTLALANTALWGVVFGVAFWRSGDLWLPIGLHLGWNWVLPLLGVNLSGFTMNVTGCVMRWRPGLEWLGGGAYGPEASPLTSVVVAGLLLWLMLKAPVRRQTPYLLRDWWEEIGPGEPVKE